MSKILFSTLQGEPKESIIISKLDKTKSFAKKIFDFRDLSSRTAPNSGYVVDTLKSALWAFWITDCFETRMIKVIQLGGDSDTLSAVYGQVASAYYELEGIPIRWRETLYLANEIANLAKKLLEKGE